MPTAYHVDRTNDLDVGDTLELENEPFISPTQKVVPSEEEVAAIREAYPEGLSRHGSRYAYLRIGTKEELEREDPLVPFIGYYELLDEGSEELENVNENPTNAMFERIFELVRKAGYSERPSRFQSFFGFESFEEANQFRSEYGAKSQIVKVEYDNGFPADMTLLSCHSYAHGLHRASMYWEGNTNNDDPIWELIIEPPVHVVEVVNSV